MFHPCILSFSCISAYVAKALLTCFLNKSRTMTWQVVWLAHTSDLFMFDFGCTHLDTKGSVVTLFILPSRSSQDTLTCGTCVTGSCHTFYSCYTSGLFMFLYISCGYRHTRECVVTLFILPSRSCYHTLTCVSVWQEAVTPSEAVIQVICLCFTLRHLSRKVLRCLICVPSKKFLNTRFRHKKPSPSSFHASKLLI